MAAVKIPAPIEAFINAVNAGDETAFLASFAPTSFVDDSGRIFSGRAAIKNWSSVELIGASGVLTPTAAATNSAEIIVTGDWSSNHHAMGARRFTFALDSGKIVSMTIRSQ